MALSKSAVDKLGERLRDGTATEADWDLLEELRTLRQRQLTALVERLRTDLGIEVTSRVKTTNTLVEKLQRERMRLSQMDDIAGARMKVHGTRLEQDALVEQLLEIWPNARVKDRRVTPVHGYRAVHVLPTVDGWPIEIQVRTARQDAAANLLEALADRWGRQIRYGGEPDAPDEPLLAAMPDLTRRSLLHDVLEVAGAVAEAEEARVSTTDRTFPPDALQVIDRWESAVDRWLLALHQIIDTTDR